MSSSIRKYELLWDSNPLGLPADARVLHVHEQRGKICMWVLGSWEQPVQLRTFNCYGTGHELPEGEARVYCGTAHLPHAGLVIHVFEVS